MDQVADKKSGAGVSKSMIQALEDDDSTRDVGYSNIVKLASFYGVSADYLLGLSEVTSTDPTIQAISKSTGLSERTLEKLKYFNNVEPTTARSEGFNQITGGMAPDIINFFLEHPKLGEFIYNAYQAMATFALDVPEGATGGEFKEVEEAAHKLGIRVFQQDEAIAYFRQEAINALRDIVYDLIPDKRREQ